MADEAKKGKSRKTRGVIDRVEDGGTAVVLLGDDEGESVELPASLLPAGAGGGDHLDITVTLDPASREAAASRVRELQERLERRGGADAEKKSIKL